jgi:prepilin-type N-terminal cleavage/methylation domain-containing protein
MKKSRGFTLVEMLIVIAVIGVLAVAVLSAINPIEQMRKARDTRRRSNAAELLNALERYYATTESYPSDFTSAHAVANTCAAATGGGAVGSGAMGDLVANDELKIEYTDRITATAANYLYAGGDWGNTDLAIVCYEIESQANINKYAGASNYCSAAAAGPHYICLPE